MFSVDETNASNYTLSSKNLIIKGEGYTFRFEYNKDYVIVHLRDIEKFTKEVFIDMQIRLDDFGEFVKEVQGGPIWAAVPKDDTKIKRLIGGLGFKFVGHHEDLTVYTREV